MKLENTFTVDASLEQTWDTLLDIERVARCLPGAKIEADPQDGVYRGAMKMKLGPMTVDYRGTARLQDIDEDTHTASIAVQAREATGQGTAAAVISNHLEARNGATTVIAMTDLNITGRQARFGRGIMEDVAARMMTQFAERLEAEIRGEEGEGAGDQAPLATGADPNGSDVPRGGSPAPEGEVALDVGSVLMGAPMIRYASIGALVGLVLLVVTALLRGRRRQITFNVNLKR